PAPELGIFLEKTLLEVEAEIPRFVVLVFRVEVRQVETVDLAVPEQHVEQRFAPIFGIGVESFRRPHLVRREPLRKFGELPEVRPGLAGRIYELVPDMRPPLRVSVCAFLLYPHRGWQD